MPHPCPVVLVLGPQGSGKGTQAALLADAIGFDHVSTGAVLRHHVNRDSPLGARVRRCLERGELVPDDVMLRLVEAELDAAEHGVVLDGFPRTVDQAVALASLASAEVVAAVVLTAPLDVLLDRLTRRRECPGCRATALAPAGYVDTVACPNGDGIAVRRSDDAPRAIARRLATYDQQATALLAWCRGAAPLVTVDGDRPVLTVLDDIVAGLVRHTSRIVPPAAVCRAVQAVAP